MEAWLGISHALFHDLKPDGATAETFGTAMSAEAFAALVDRETTRVNEALISMSLAADKFEVRRIFNALSRDTVIVLFSRWAHYQGEWTKLRDESSTRLWIPPFDLWRAIFLEMTDDIPAATEAARMIWGEGLKA
jgi:hypothetical protein